MTVANLSFRITYECGCYQEWRSDKVRAVVFCPDHLADVNKIQQVLGEF